MHGVLIIGVVGAGLILLAFTLNEIRKWSVADLQYQIVNLVGAGLLILYSWLIASWPFLVLNIVWFLVALKHTFVRPKH